MEKISGYLRSTKMGMKNGTIRMETEVTILGNPLSVPMMAGI